MLVKAAACGICGSDVLEWYRIKKAPIVLGHEMVAGDGRGWERMWRRYRVGAAGVCISPIPLANYGAGLLWLNGVPNTGLPIPFQEDQIFFRAGFLRELRCGNSPFHSSGREQEGVFPRRGRGTEELHGFTESKGGRSFPLGEAPLALVLGPQGGHKRGLDPGYFPGPRGASPGTSGYWGEQPGHIIIPGNFSPPHAFKGWVFGKEKPTFWGRPGQGGITFQALNRDGLKPGKNPRGLHRDWACEQEFWGAPGKPGFIPHWPGEDFDTGFSPREKQLWARSGGQHRELVSHPFCPANLWSQGAVVCTPGETPFCPGIFQNKKGL